MAARFLLRGKDDTSNPICPRLYSLGITAGRNLFYLPNASGNRTGFITILAEGARFTGDTGCVGALKVLFAGFEIPEFDASGGRNWRFHKGTIPAPPAYFAASFNASTGRVAANNHPLQNNDPVAFHSRKTSGTAATLPNGIETHKKYFVVNKTTNDFQISESINGAAIAFDVNSSGAVFAYLANVGIFDLEQGTPDFFPALKRSFAGLCYLEILLPADLSNGEDEPTKLKVMLDGKAVFDFVKNDSTGILEQTGNPVSARNNALISWDAMRYDGDIDPERFNADSWIEWRNRCAEKIGWLGGNSSPAPVVYASQTNVTVNQTENSITKTGGTNTDFDARVSTAQYTTRNGRISFRYKGGDVAAGFTGNADGTNPQQGVVCLADGSLMHNLAGIWQQVGTIAISDRVDIEYDGGIFKLAKNVIPIALDRDTMQPSNSFYAGLEIRTLGTKVESILIAPSGTSGLPRLVDRFTGGLVLLNETPVAEVFEAEIRLSAASWQDVDGEIVILPRPDKPIVHTFIADPNASIPANCSRITVKRRPAKNAYSYFPASFRDLDDPVLTRKYVFTNRPNLKYRPAAMTEYGVFTQSQIERLGEYQARLTSDLDIGWTVEAFLDSLAPSKGDHVFIVDPASGFSEENPARAEIVSDLLLHNGSVETKKFECAIITQDVYSDTAHGAVSPVTHNNISVNYLPPPPIESLVLSETTRNLDNATISVLEGDALFAPSANQRGQVFARNLGQSPFVPNFVNGANEMNNPALGALLNKAVCVVDLYDSNDFPNGISGDKKYYVRYSVNTAGRYQLEDAETGQRVSFTGTGGAAVRLFEFVDWTNTNLVITPNAETRHGVFALEPAAKGFWQVRIVTRSAGGAALPFYRHQAYSYAVTGDQSAPLPPSDLRAIFDGVNLRFDFTASASENVAGYQVTDAKGGVIDALRFIQTLGWTETAQSQTTARRVYAVSRNGVRSVNFAALEFQIFSRTYWQNIAGGGVLSDGTLVKRAATLWGNAGAILSKAVITDEKPARLSFIADTNNQFKIFGFSTRENVLSFEDFRYACYLLDNGVILAKSEAESGGGIYAGTYAVGDEFAIYLTPSDTTGESPSASLWRVSPNGTETKILDYPAFPSVFPLFAGVALYAVNSTFPPTLKISGELVTATAKVPRVANVVNVSFDDQTGRIAWLSGNGSLNSAETIQSGGDGEFSFYYGGAGTIARAGFALDLSEPFMPFHLRFSDDGSVALYENEVLLQDLGFALTSDKWSFTREAGVWRLRKNGALITTAETSEQYAADAVFFKAELTAGTLERLRFRPADDAPTTARQSIAQSLIGNNFIDDIPRFRVSDAPDNSIAAFRGGEVVAVEMTDENNFQPVRDLTVFASDIKSDEDGERTIYAAYIDSLLQKSGDKIEAFFAGEFLSAENTKTLSVDFGAARVFEVNNNSSISGQLSGFYRIDVVLMRTGNNELKSVVSMTADNFATSYVSILDGFTDWNQSVALKLVGESQNGGEIVAHLGSVRFTPSRRPLKLTASGDAQTITTGVFAAQAGRGGQFFLTEKGKQLTENGDRLYTA